MKNLSLSLSGGNNPRAIPVVIKGIFYTHKRQAMKELNLTKGQLNKLLTTNLA